MKKVYLFLVAITLTFTTYSSELQAHCTYKNYPFTNFFNVMQGKDDTTCPCAIKNSDNDKFTPDIRSAWSGGFVASKCKECSHPRTLHDNN